MIFKGFKAKGAKNKWNVASVWLQSVAQAKKRIKGFTLVELLIASLILGILITTAASVYSNVYKAVRNIRGANIVYEEARFIIERIAKEVRNGTIDYEEYYNQAANFFGQDQKNTTYGKNYCQYSQKFYTAGLDGQYGTYDDQSTGKLREGEPNPIENPIQKSLFIINGAGNKRTYIRRIEAEVDGEIMGKIGFLKLKGKDCGVDRLCVEDEDIEGNDCEIDAGEKDGLVDTWACEEGYNCTSKEITSGLLGSL